MKTWLALSLLAAGAHAGQRCHSADQPLSATNWSTTLQVPKHDPTIGQLESVTITLRSRNEFDLGVENLSPIPATIQHSLGATVTARRPDFSTILATAVDMQAQATLGAFDGMIDFNGPSGVTFTNLHEFSETSVVLNGPADLALFTATTPGEAIGLPSSSLGSSSGSGPGNIVVVFGTRTGAQIRVCYGYRETCHADSVPSTLTNWQTTRSFAKHDPVVGPLHAVRVRVRTALTGSIGIENPGAAALTATSTLAVRTAIQRPDATELIGFETAHVVVDDLAPFDGTIDFAGPSGESYAGIASQSSADVTLTSPADLALFTASAPGETITLGLSGLGTSTAMGAGPLVTQFTTSSAVDVIEVCYDFGSHLILSCAGDGSLAACPCGNDSPVGALQGCLNSSGLGGELRGTGTASLGDDTLVLAASNLPLVTFAVLLQGTTLSPMPFGDGILCVGGVTQRLGTRATAGGIATFPQPGTTISQLGGASAGLTLHYQAWYRNAVSFCTPATFNLTNALGITW